MTTAKHSHLKASQRMFFSLCLVLLGWAFFSIAGISSAVGIWSVSEIFQHCFLVIPGAMYLIWQERSALQQLPIRPAWQALPVVCGQLALYVVGVAGDIQLFMHVAAFSLLPTLIWLVIGNRAAYQIMFPLLFMLFAIPIGEELVPWLQAITADIAVYLLQLTGVPLFRTGLYIEVPGGTFLVAEACSGISFFIASVVIGNLYAYMNLVSWPRRVGFVMLSIVYPIVANAVRVYGIILTGYLSDMEHAVGADHLVYGWVFFAMVIVSLIFLGELFRCGDSGYKDIDKAHAIPYSTSNTPRYWVVFLVLILLGAAQWWQAQVQNRIEAPWSYSNTPVTDVMSVGNNAQWSVSLPSTPWAPQFHHAAAEQLSTHQYLDQVYQSYQVSFDGKHGELVNFQNKLYLQDRWTLVERNQVTLSDSSVVLAEHISSPRGEQQVIYYAYWFDGQWYSSKTKVKLMQTFAALLHRETVMRLFAIKLPVTNDKLLQQRHLAIINNRFAEYLTRTDALRLSGTNRRSQEEH
ncbi:MAG: exosortase [Alteromonadaceae bacterium]|nr:exosortase [Alteromonadaceae bacterium]